MIHITSDELGELQHCVSTLELTLETLDRIGAGIAAIHVDAAVSQLKKNIDLIAPKETPETIVPLLCGGPQFIFSP